MMNKSGFTLIELLTVIVILGIISTIAVPEYSKYIENSKRDAFVIEANNYVDSVAASIVSQVYKAPIQINDVTVVSLDMIEIVSGNKKSPYGYDWVKGKSYVVVINEGTASSPRYAYYFAAQDENRNAIPLTKIGDITRDSITNEAKNTMEVTVQSLAGNISGATTTKGIISGLENAIEGDKTLDWNVTTYTNQE